MSKHIIIENAHQNNLKGLDLTLPHGELIVVTGVSGSGKSTLAFDTIYAEGQRRYVETFSPYARQFLDRMDKPRVDRIEGIPPAIAIDQTNPVRTSRSTVGTMTELNDHIKLLFARTAKLYCGSCGDPIQRDTPEGIGNQWLSKEPSQRVMVTFDIPVPENFTPSEVTDWLARQGYTRVHQQNKTHISVIQDRLRLSEDNQGRFIEAIEAGLRFGQGRVSVHPLNEQREPVSQHTYSTVLQCESCQRAYRDPSSASFSFNSPLGACEQCKGFGRVIGIDYRLAVPDTRKTLREGAVKVFQTDKAKKCQDEMEHAAWQADIPLDTPYQELSAEQQQWVINGDKKQGGQWYGIRGFFDFLERKSYRMHVRVMLAKYRSYDLCTACHGARLKPDSLDWRVGTLAQANQVTDPLSRHRSAKKPLPDAVMSTLPGLNIADLLQLPIEHLRTFVDLVAESHADEATVTVIREMQSRLTYLCDVGLGYLSPDRQSRTLSGGEVQRINLTTALGTSLVNTLFVLDEPSIGLHARDMDRLIRVLHRLRDAGNTLLVVEHDPQLMMAADRIIDMGPGPGQAGGQIIFNGRPQQLLARRRSLTAAYLNGEKALSFTPTPRCIASAPRLELHGAHGHNLQHITLQLPLQCMVCLTGPSGSGKSTLIQDTLYNALCTLKGKPKDLAQPFDQLIGHEHISDVVLVDQSPIGKSARSNPVSYTGAFEAIRKLFEKVPEAKERGYKASAFSFNSGMRCPACSGNGFEHVEMQFLSDVYLRCAECQGRRYRPELLEIKWFSPHDPQGRSIADVLDMTVDAALAFFADEATVIQALQPLHSVGLGYLQLGQPVPTLSGGEAQRLKLAAYLGQAELQSRRSSKKKDNLRSQTLFLFDEPTTGLHFDDIQKLLTAFEQLVAQGHSLLVIEHNLDVITRADWIIDLGPEGGDAGGQIVCEGTPAQVMQHARSVTAASLREYQAATNKLRTDAVAEASAPGIMHADTRITTSEAIEVHKAREHNLKNIDVQIPRDALTVITGMSGSGKSTLAFDIIFNEGQRRYLESLNAYARQFVQPASRPEVDAINGIPPTVAIEQRTSRGGRKSTVATMTEIYHFLRLLFVKLGIQYCPDCGVPISAQSVEAITAQIIKRFRGKTVTLYAPLIVDRKGYYTDLAKWALNKGFETLRVDGQLLPTADWPRLDRFKEHTIDLPVNTLDVDVKHEQMLSEQIQRAIDYGSGVVKIGSTVKNERLFSTQRACPSCQQSFAELDPRMFSYNSRHGWCENCFGTGQIIPGFDEEQTGEEQNWQEPNDADPVTCPGCEGQRLRPESLSVYFQDWSIADYTALSIADASDMFEQLYLDEREQTIARDSLKELQSRLHFLQSVGLAYLSLDRSAPTLSGGEAQRIRLAAQLGSNLQGVCYILDEPTIGLHPRDNRMLLDTLAELRAKGNTVIVVEHDEETIRSADHLIDIGPGAGVRGGEIVAAGTVSEVRKNPNSITGQLLDQPLQHPLTPPRKKAEQVLSIHGAHLHNLKNVSVDLPLSQLVCVSGVSGSGKSTLIRDVLHTSLRTLNGQKRKRSPGPSHGCESITGWEPIGRVLEVDQTPIGKTSRSCPATYVGFWDNIRRLFTETTEARIRGYDAGRFSFNTGGGRCEACAGQGLQRIEMNFLPDVRILCEVCNGLRFNHETLSVTYKGLSIGDVLMMNVDDAVAFFANHNSIHHALRLLQDVGLGYLTLGQQSRTLSGGEAQRIKLVTELARAKPTDSGRRGAPILQTLYILDEPTVGLHTADVEKLIGVLQRLVDAGHSVIVIEHNLDILAEADWLVDMGPEGGDAGGRVVARGQPSKVALSKRSRTAPFLREILGR